MSAAPHTSWRDLLVLLRGERNILQTCDAIVDLLRCELTAIPDVVHEVVFGLLVSTTTHVRLNGATLLGLIALEFTLLFEKLVTDSPSDGNLLTLMDIDVSRIERNSTSFFVSSHSSTLSMAVYSKNWLVQQKKELRKRIGWECANDVPGAAAEYDGVENCLLESDVHAEPRSFDGSKSVESGPPPLQLNVSQSRTEETWLARVLRCMIVGLLDPKWEIRHGFSLGLTSILRNLLPDSPTDGAHALAPTVLPTFICDDIMCCGVCVLLLDRLMDFSASASNKGSLSPVKEAAGELLLCALRCRSSREQCGQLWKIIHDMVNLRASHWTSVLGGYIALKHFLMVHTAFLSEQSDMDNLVQLLTMGWQEGVTEEITCAALACLVVWCDQQASNITNGAQSQMVCAACIGLVRSLGSEMSRLLSGASPSLTLSLSTASACVHGLVASIVTTTPPVARTAEVVDLCGRLLTAQASLLSVLYLFDDKVRGLCWQDVAPSLTHLQHTLQALVNHELDNRIGNALLDQLYCYLGALVASACFATCNPAQELLLEEAAPAGSGSGTVKGAAAVRRKRGRAELQLEQELSAEDTGRGLGPQKLGVTPEKVGEGTDTTAVCERYYADRELWSGVISLWGACLLTGLGLGQSEVHAAVWSVTAVLLGAGLTHSCTHTSPAQSFKRTFTSIMAAFVAHERIDTESAPAGCLHLLDEGEQCRVACIVSALVRACGRDPEAATGIAQSSFMSALENAALDTVRASITVPNSTVGSALVAQNSGSTVPAQVYAAPVKKRFRFVVVPDKPNNNASRGSSITAEPASAATPHAKHGSALLQCEWKLKQLYGACAMLLELRGTLGLPCSEAVNAMILHLQNRSVRTPQDGSVAAADALELVLQALTNPSAVEQLPGDHSGLLVAHVAHHAATAMSAYLNIAKAAGSDIGEEEDVLLRLPTVLSQAVLFSLTKVSCRFGAPVDLLMNVHCVLYCAASYRTGASVEDLLYES
jgi:hypothetical protein